MITINMNKALTIRQNQIRAERAAMLAALDVQYMRAMEQGDTAEQQRIAAEKQRLRDATQHPDLLAAQTPEQLLAVNPL